MRDMRVARDGVPEGGISRGGANPRGQGDDVRRGGECDRAPAIAARGGERAEGEPVQSRERHMSPAGAVPSRRGQVASGWLLRHEEHTHQGAIAA